VQLIQLGLGDDQLVLVQLQLACSLATYPIPLTARLAAEPTRPAHRLAREHPSAPTAPRPLLLWIIDDFRHDESVDEIWSSSLG
jgi:hypothetical protein